MKIGQKPMGRIMPNKRIPAQRQDLSPLIEEYLSYLCSVRGMAERTLEAYRLDIARFVVYCKKQGIAAEVAASQDVQRFLVDISAEDKAAVTVNRALASIRGFYRWLVRLGYRKDNPAGVLPSRKTPKTLPVFLWVEEMAVFAALPEYSHILWPLRDTALILTMYSGGLRISEVVSLAVQAVEGDLRSARVIGKGDKERYVFFSDEAAEALEAYLPARREKINQRVPTNQLFINQKGEGISVSGVRWIIGQYTQRSGLQKQVHPHSLRHSFAAHLVNAGCDVRVVQALLGHESIATTQRYTHVNMERLKAVYAKAHPHGGKKPGEGSTNQGTSADGTKEGLTGSTTGGTIQ
ncbi:MAG: tyrosine recombinase [Treponema sp.]|nr:tyrosine recombinase [Treponema sp.]